MPHYILSVHSPLPDPDAPAAPQQQPDPEQMEAMMARHAALEEDMKAQGAWTFSGHLGDASTATVVRKSDGETVLTDGPYLESKEHVAGFYIIEADDLDAATDWAGKVVDAIGMSALEVRPMLGFQA